MASSLLTLHEKSLRELHKHHAGSSSAPSKSATATATATHRSAVFAVTPKPRLPPMTMLGTCSTLDNVPIPQSAHATPTPTHNEVTMTGKLPALDLYKVSSSCTSMRSDAPFMPTISEVDENEEGSRRYLGLDNRPSLDLHKKSSDRLSAGSTSSGDSNHP